MLFYLQTACVVITIIHTWIQPYQNELLNAFDGVLLMLIVLIVNIDIFPLLRNVTTEIALIIIILPLILLITIIIKNALYSLLKKWHYCKYDPLIDYITDEDEVVADHDMVIRYVQELHLDSLCIAIMSSCRNAHHIHKLDEVPI